MHCMLRLETKQKKEKRKKEDIAKEIFAYR